MDYKKLADLLFPDVKNDIEFYFNKYPKRELKDGAEVTRIAPSPTGFLHLGTAYGALIDYLIARKTDGVFYMRLEDTDQKREIENAGAIAYDMLCYYDIKPSEGYAGNFSQVGSYGDYIQSHRIDIYRTFAKHLVSIGRAFPCFCEKSENKEDILARRNEQLESGDNIEVKDPCRNLTYEEIEQNIKLGKPFAIRLLSKGDAEKTFEFEDLIKGKRTLRENDKDIVLLKSNGIPPYSLAHIVDDTLMGTTIVVRGEEWYSSLPAHLEVFDAFGFKRPRYAHTPVICKHDEQGNKRKLSKRKDAEADARYYIEKGYPKQAVVEYLLNLLNSDFEEWRMNNPTSDYNDFDFDISKIGSNNPMFDIVKLEDISKQIISHYTPNQIYESVCEWAKEFDKEFYEVLNNNKDMCLQLFSIDRVDTPKPRKDIGKWSDVKGLYSYMFKELCNLNELSEYKSTEDFRKEIQAKVLESYSHNYNENIIEKLIVKVFKTFLSIQNENISKENTVKVLQAYLPIYDENDDKQVWFNKIKGICEPLGFSADMKAYKKNPEQFLGSVADVSGIIRIAVTGRKNTPDLFYICKLLGANEVRNRIQNAIKLLSK